MLIAVYGNRAIDDCLLELKNVLTEQCAKNCPVGAISFDDPTCTDKSKCITYMRCIAECPKKAKCLPSVLVSVVSTVAKSQFKGRKANFAFL